MATASKLSKGLKLLFFILALLIPFNGFSAVNKKPLDLETCQPQLLKSHLESSLVKSEDKRLLTERLALLEQARKLIEVKLTSLEQLNAHLEALNIEIENLSICPGMQDKLTGLVGKLQKLKTWLSPTGCEVSALGERIASLGQYSQPLAHKKRLALLEKKARLLKAQKSFLDAQAPFRQGIPKVALEHLMAADEAIKAYRCPVFKQKVHVAITQAKQMNKALLKPQKALVFCEANTLNAVLHALKPNSGRDDLIGELKLAQKATASLRRAKSFYQQGELERAEKLLKRAKINLLGHCVNLNEEIDDKLSRIKGLKQTKKTMMTAIRQCDNDSIAASLSRVNTKTNPYVAELLPALKEARIACKKLSPQDELNLAHARCEKQFGFGVVAEKHPTTGKMTCECKPGLRWSIDKTFCMRPNIQDGHLRCAKKFGDKTRAIRIQEDGFYQCQCEQGFRFNEDKTRCVKKTLSDGHKVCNQQFGAHAYALSINSRGGYQCQCKKGYRWNKKQTYCIEMTQDDGDAECRHYFGDGAYSVKANDNGSYDCQCTKWYKWNKGQTRCILINQQDGFTQCQKHFGRTSYPIRHLGRNQWDCYDPRKT